MDSTFYFEHMARSRQSELAATVELRRRMAERTAAAWPSAPPTHRPPRPGRRAASAASCTAVAPTSAPRDA